MSTHITLKVPATTANLGSGYDCIGMALDIWNTVTFTTDSSGLEISGEGASELSGGKDNLVYSAFSFLFKNLGIPIPEIAISCHNKIPISRGLGSSSASIISGLLAANQLCDSRYNNEEILAMATEIEGHSDNVSAALFGGLQIVLKSTDSIFTSTVPIPKMLSAVVFIPDQSIDTRDARSLLGKSVKRSDAVFNMSRVALLINGMSTGNLSLLKTATEDRLHQQAREKIFPAMKPIIKAALDSGALGAFLSGSGSAILALVNDRHMTIGYEMAEAASKSGVSGHFEITKPSVKGAQVEVDSR